MLPEAIRFCFDVCRRDTVLEGAELEIVEIEGRGRCRDCGRDMPLQRLFDQCFCGSHAIECLAGQELIVKEMEVSD